MNTHSEQSNNSRNCSAKAANNFFILLIDHSNGEHYVKG